MFKNLTYRKKIKYLMVGAGLFLLLCYVVSINKTVALVQQCHEMEELLTTVADAPEKIKGISKRIGEIENSVSSGEQGNSNFQEKLLEKVSHYCQSQRLILREFPQIHKYTQQNYNVETFTVAVEGPYVKLLKLVYLFESTRLGKVISIKFESKKDYRTNSMRLVSTIYLQNIKNIKNEN